jgi:geranylgeranylglycerol-phosphate geranylgeranyltransferase
VSTWSKLRDVAVLTRLHNCLLASASVLIGSVLASHSITRGSLFGASSVLFVSAGGYALNDIYDIRTDRMSKPWRALPSGRVGKRGAVQVTAVTWAAGLALSVPAGPVAAGFALTCMLLIWLYSAGIKSAGLAGHLLVSALASSGFLLGGALGHSARAAVLPFSIALGFHFAREVVKGAGDMRGDKGAGIRTLPVRMGERGSSVLCIASIAAVMALGLIPFAAGAYGISYLVPVLAMQPFLALSIYTITSSRRNGVPVAKAYARAATILKAVMPVGMLAFLLGGM